MTKPINLNKVRKARTKAKKQVETAQNRAKFGRTKAQKTADALQLENTKREIDGKQLDL